MKDNNTSPQICSTTKNERLVYFIKSLWLNPSELSRVYPYQNQIASSMAIGDMINEGKNEVNKIK